jgi:TonB family protein
MALGQVGPYDPPDLLEAPPHSQAGHPPASPLSRVLEILSDTRGTDFYPYLREANHKIQQNWRALATDLPRNGVTDFVRLAVEFSVAKDGTVTNVALPEPSGNAALDQAAKDAIAKSVPFAALPESFPGSSITLRAHFFNRPHQFVGEAAGNNSGNSGIHQATTDNQSPDENNVYRAGHGVSPPKGIYLPDPPYTDAARKAGVEGVVILKLVVTADGSVRDITVQKSLSPDLDQSAFNTVSQWKFEPGMKDGQPVAVRINVEVNFR